ncbi:MAG: hypothetical protein R3B84_23370 [Zavarzinella sp.]
MNDDVNWYITDRQGSMPDLLNDRCFTQFTGINECMAINMTSFYLDQLHAAKTHLLARGVVFASGMLENELQSVEARFSFRFPPDLRVFLQWGLPIGTRFPDWRDPDEFVFDRLRWPAEGIYIDIRNQVFWWSEWGDRPQNVQEAVELASSRLSQLPPLIPIYGHSYIPSEPNAEENPVFSIHQADVIHRGRNLAEYLLWSHHDQTDPTIEDRYPVFDDSYKVIPFWTDLAMQNYS